MMQLILFAVSALVLLFGHFLMGLAAIKLFSLTSVTAKIIVASAMIALFVSAILSSLLIHKIDNLLTRWYYMLSGFGIGLLVNFLLVAAFVFILKYVLVRVGYPLLGWQVSVLTIILTTTLTAYGLFGAFFPRVKEYEVRIKDLPLAWQGKEVVQISDVHLGPVYRKHYFARIMDKVNALSPEAVFITGDLFDGMESDFSWMNTPFAKLNAPKGVYYSFGNHDLYLGFNRVHELLKNNPVTILDNKLELVDGLQIIGINYSFNKDFDLYETILEQSGYDERHPSLLLFHEPKNMELAAKAGIDLQLSGHTHRGQLFPFNFLASLAYQGNVYGLYQKDTFSLIVNGGLGTWGPPLRTSSRSEIVKIKLLAL